MVSLTIAVAIYLFVESVLEFILAILLRPLSGSGWLFVDGIVTLILAVLIWRTWPSNTALVLRTLVGISSYSAEHTPDDLACRVPTCQRALA
jgi:uncharacterized membrane protein HdeD (DUF308 family)